MSAQPLTIQEFHEGMHRHFNVRGNAGRFLCQTFLMMGKVSINILAFDDWVHQQYGDYEDDREISLSDLIMAEYGPAAHQFISRCLGR